MVFYRKKLLFFKELGHASGGRGFLHHWTARGGWADFAGKYFKRLYTISGSLVKVLKAFPRLTTRGAILSAKPRSRSRMWSSRW